MSGRHKELDPRVVVFEHTTLKPLALQAHPHDAGKLQARLAFRVHLHLDIALPDPALYEYRQAVRGSGYTHRGQWHNGVWQAIQTRHPGGGMQIVQPEPIAPSLFSIATVGAKGLHASRWSEDGMLHQGALQHFGHRGATFEASDAGSERYFDHDRQYESERSCGVDGVDLVLGLRVSLRLQFKGSVVRFDKPPGTPDRRVVEEIVEKEWAYVCDATVGSVAPLIVVG
jgi:hypothetical protein